MNDLDRIAAEVPILEHSPLEKILKISPKDYCRTVTASLPQEYFGLFGGLITTVELEIYETDIYRLFYLSRYVK